MPNHNLTFFCFIHTQSHDVSGGRGSGYAGPADAPTGGKPEASGSSSAATSGQTSGGRGSGYAGPPNAPTGGKPENAVAPKGSPQDYSNGGVNWTYWGCWTDRSDKDGRALTGSYSASKVRTIEGCLRACAKQNFQYAGLENGNECRCGKSLEPFSKATAQCGKKCTAGNGQTCGGDYALSVYKTK